jgi:sporulation related protein
VRNAFLALVLVNVAYFAWARWIDVPQPPPVNDAIGHLPKLKLAEEAPDAQKPQPGAEKTALEGTACLSVGPFADLDNSARAAALLKEKGFATRQRAEQGQTTEGYWVYVGGMRTQTDTDRALVSLEHSGIKDAVVMPETADAGRRISLGLYTDRGRADKRAQLVLRDTGLKAEVAERKLPGAQYWVDLTPPQGVNTVPLRDLFAQGVSTRIAVQPCPLDAPAPQATPASGTAATAPGIPSAPLPATARNPTPPVSGPPKLP